MNWTHDGLAEDLAAHLSADSSRMIWLNMQLGPMHSPRPDVFVINKSYAKPNPVSYECKVSVSDFRSDVTKGKWRDYLAFSEGVIFAVPAGLIAKEDVPAGCGLIVRHGSSWRIAKRPTLSTVSMSRDVMMKLLIDGVERARKPYRQKAFIEYLAVKKIRGLLGDEVADYLRDASSCRASLDLAQARAKSIVEAAEQNAEKIIDRQRRADDVRLNVLRNELRSACEMMRVEYSDNISDCAKRITERLSSLAYVRDTQLMNVRIADAIRSLSKIRDDLEGFQLIANPGEIAE